MESISRKRAAQQTQPCEKNSTEQRSCCPHAAQEAVGLGCFQLRFSTSLQVYGSACHASPLQILRHLCVRPQPGRSSCPEQSLSPALLTTLWASTVLSPPSDKETGSERVSRRLPAHHLSICCSLCLEHSSPVTIPADIHTLQVSTQISPERGLSWAPALLFSSWRSSPPGELRPPHVCVSCPSSPTRVPKEGPDPCWILESRDLTPSAALLRTLQPSTGMAHIRDRASMYEWS